MYIVHTNLVTQEIVYVIRFSVSTAFFRPLGIFLLTVQLAIISAAPLNDLEGRLPSLNFIF